ncbi:MAG: CCA tRNA nucleotidyltransferase [Pseudomonadota bacterium]
MRLDAPWLHEPRTQSVMHALVASGGRAWFVGGCVRNTILGRPIQDIDIATDLQPEAVISKADAAGLKAVPTGIAHGTVTVVADGKPFEVTTLRRDLETDGRHAQVAFTSDIVADAQRRDFTMNALYADATGRVTDPVGGLPDLETRRVRFVGAPEQRIAEDYLRILRFFRFHAWYGDPKPGLDPPALAACAAAADGLELLSRERVSAELTKLLSAPDPAPALDAMAATGILERVLPGASTDVLSALVDVERAAAVEPRWQRRISALGSASEWAEDLCFSKSDRKFLIAIQSVLEDRLGSAEAAYRFGPDAARDGALIAAARAGKSASKDLEAEILRGARAVFPIKAKDLDLEGPALGKALRDLEKRWILSDFRASAAELLAGSGIAGESDSDDAN